MDSKNKESMKQNRELIRPAKLKKTNHSGHFMRAPRGGIRVTPNHTVRGVVDDIVRGVGRRRTL